MVKICMDPCNKNPLTGSHPPCLRVTVEPVLRRQGKYDDSTWRCPGESADSRAGDWLLAGGCHSIPKQSTICSGIVVMRTKAGMGERGGDNAGRGSWNAKEVIFSYENVLHWLPPSLWRIVMEDSAWCPTHQKFTMRQCPFVRCLTLRKVFLPNPSIFVHCLG